MAFQAKDVMGSASTILQDAGTIRWTPPELLNYLNEGVREIVAVKPNAASQTVNMTLAAGPRQTLEATHTVLSRAVRNVVSGKPIRVLDRREILDNMIPGWMNTANLTYALDVVYIVQDMTDPRTFYVAPGALVTSSIEIVVGVMPAVIAQGTSVLDTSTYTGAVGLPDLYRNCLVDYVLYRSFAKDAGIPGAAQRAVSHKGLFDAALASIANGENAMSLASYAQRGPGSGQ
ncbi:DUF6682 family protein [Cypionkella sp.]|uniref:phage adaptor protein n=1 Tax=Cypionkella sp. TaxID=2811411 RepID=UPI0027198A0E|nr:DUF6682 family protein [Cypionkella sp.]MDO8983018.1 hypothetical protein [Cypionkella sp.]